jgi:hypothetical protein
MGGGDAAEPEADKPRGEERPFFNRPDGERLIDRLETAPDDDTARESRGPVAESKDETAATADGTDDALAADPDASTAVVDVAASISVTLADDREAKAPSPFTHFKHCHA